jgi:short subunit fatty acids transporter
MQSIIVISILASIKRTMAWGGINSSARFGNKILLQQQSLASQRAVVATGYVALGLSICSL